MKPFKAKTCLVGSLILGAVAPALAQSNVTVYGVADVYLQYGKGDQTQTRLESGGESGSRLGFKGSEDLGGGLSAMFKLESGIALDTGTVTQGGRMWGRQAFVGLAGGFGSVSAGRQYTPHFTTIDDADPFGTGAGSAASSGIVTILATRADNSIVYSAPKLGPVSISLLGSLGEGVTGRFYSANAQYSADKLDIGLAFARQEHFARGEVNASAVILTGAYDFGAFKVTGGVQSVKNLTRAANTDDDRNEFFGGVLVPIGSGTLTAGAGTGKTKKVGGSKATQLSLGYDHSLSKRTNLYVIATGIDNGRVAAYTADAATGSGPPVSAGNDVRALLIGVRHRF